MGDVKGFLKHDRAKTAYRAAGREDAWHAYLTRILETHRRKYRLMPLLRALASD